MTSHEAMRRRSRADRLGELRLCAAILGLLSIMGILSVLPGAPQAPVAFRVAIPQAQAESLSAARDRLAAAIQKKDFPAATSAVDSLIEMDSAEAIEALVSLGLKGDFYGVERYIGGRILGLPEGAAFDRACELASRSKDPKVRVLLTLVLGTRSEASAYRAVLQNLYDKDDGVVLAALEKLREKDQVGSIGHLIEALAHQEKQGRADGLIAYELRTLLLQLTREDIVRADDWRNWWKPREEGFQRPEGDAKETDRKVTSVYREPPTFFGREVPAEKVVFLLDISLSMAIRDPAPEEIGAGEQEGGRGGTAVPKPPEEDPPEEPAPTDIPLARERLARVKAELIQTIERLPEKTQFTIVTFNHEIVAMSETLLPATDRNKQKAIDFVRAMKPNGETWTDHALSKAFETPGLRAIFLLSDGAPRRDEVLLPTEPILEWIREANRFARVRIHTVGFEQAGKSMRKFLRAVSAQNNGTYTELR